MSPSPSSELRSACVSSRSESVAGQASCFPKCFDGSWTNEGYQYLIRGNNMHWPCGSTTPLRYSSAGRIHMKLHNQSFWGELTAEDAIRWSDGDVWHRAEALGSARCRAPSGLLRGSGTTSSPALLVVPAAGSSPQPRHLSGPGSPAVSGGPGASVRELSEGRPDRSASPSMRGAQLHRRRHWRSCWVLEKEELIVSLGSE